MTLVKTRAERLDSLRHRIENDPAFAHFRSLDRNYVPGRGPLRPELVLVGEAPGKWEDQGGEPFIGTAGRMLDELLVHIGVERSSVYITNVVKYRPKDNRTPNRYEVGCSMPYLDRELDILQPRVVGLLGQVAVSCYFGDVRMGQVHGSLNTQRTKVGDWRSYVALYHPMFGVYDRSNRKMLFRDFEQIKHCMADKRDGVL